MPSKAQLLKDIARWVEGKLISCERVGSTRVEAIQGDAEGVQEATQVNGPKSGPAGQSASNSRMAKGHYDTEPF